MKTCNRKINILFVSHLGSAGGAEKCLLDLISKLDTSKFNIFTNIPYRGPMSNAFDEAGIAYFISHTGYWITSNKSSRLRNALQFFSTLRARIWSLEEKIKRLNIDIVYSNSVSCIDGAIAAQRMDIPHIWHLHEKIGTDTALQSFLPLALVRIILRKIQSTYIAPSLAVAQQLVSNNAYSVVPNGVDTNVFIPEQSDALHLELNLDRSTVIVTIIGAVIPAKGLSVFVESALQLLKNTESSLHFVIVGDGDNAYIEQLIQSINTHVQFKHFSFIGQRTDIPNILRSSDILVVASYSEGFSRVAIEAMACEKPVIATRCGGPESIINHKKTGLLIPTGNASALSASIQYLVEHPKKAHEIGQTARRHIIKYFSLDNYVSKIESLITAAIQDQ